MSEDKVLQANTYEISVRLLGNEIIALGLKSSNDSNKWVAIGLVSVFTLLSVLLIYGDKLVQLGRLITH